MSLHDRATSAIPISIGTSLALESVFSGSQDPYDPNREIPEKVSLSNYQECWINIETLIRNISSSVERAVYESTAVDAVLDTLLSEISIVESLFLNEGNSLCKAMFFHSEYKKINSIKSIRLKHPETAIQKSYDYKLKQVIKKLHRETDKVIRLKNTIHPKKRNNALIITHYTYDLVSEKHFNKLDLLESHTGLLKDKTKWSSKYHTFGQNSLAHLPFNEHLLFIFGDKNYILPQDRKIRQVVYDISIKDKWTPLTKVQKIKDAYKTHVSHPADRHFLTSLIHD